MIATMGVLQQPEAVAPDFADQVRDILALLDGSYQVGGGQGNVVPTDQFSLNFAKIEIEYKEQKADGTLGASVKAGFDVKSNKAV